MFNLKNFKLIEDGAKRASTVGAATDGASAVSVGTPIPDDLIKHTTDYGDTNTDGGAAAYSYTPHTPTTFSYSSYIKSPEVTEAERKKSEAEQAVKENGDFTYSRNEDLKNIMDKILGREKFSYDLNGDALYQQYKDSYMRQGKLAMQDVMGQAAAMTGGYGSSYAQTVGNQAYRGYLSELNNVIPELYQLAYDKYDREGQELYNQYGLLSDDRSTEYGVWGDKLNRRLADRSYYATEADNAYAKDYGEWLDGYDRVLSAFNANLAQAETFAKYGDYSVLGDLGVDISGTYSADDWKNALTGDLADPKILDTLSSMGLSGTQIANLAELSDTDTVKNALENGNFDALSGIIGNQAVSKLKSAVAGTNTGTTSMIKDPTEIQNWSNLILSAPTRELAEEYLEQLEYIDPNLADILYDQWLLDNQ